jgi:hypothetical protein
MAIYNTTVAIQFAGAITGQFGKQFRIFVGNIIGSNNLVEVVLWRKLFLRNRLNLNWFAITSYVYCSVLLSRRCAVTSK